eukprot:867292-Heterocapsa_arctica.AAC.1
MPRGSATRVTTEYIGVPPDFAWPVQPKAQVPNLLLDLNQDPRMPDRRARRECLSSVSKRTKGSTMTISCLDVDADGVRFPPPPRSSP